MSIQQNFPAITPSLSLNFARSKKLDPRITFTRTSSATRINETGLVEVVPANAPRFDHSYDSVSGSVRSLGLLVEESRSNLLQRSVEFDNSFWTKTNSSIQNNVIPSPDGNITANKLIEDTQNGVHRFFNNTVAIAANTTYTMSIFVKAAERSRFVLEFRDSTGQISVATFNLITGTFISNLGTQHSIINVGNGWYRLIVSATTSALHTGVGAYIFLIDNGDASSYTGDGTSGIYIWGAQLEQGSFPTSYIPTTTSTVTRTADNVSMVGENFSSWYNQSEGTIMWNGRYNAEDINLQCYSIDPSTPGGDLNNRIALFGRSGLVSGAFVPRIRSSGDNFDPASVGTPTIKGTLIKTALSYSIGSVTFTEGITSQIVTSSPTSLPTVSLIKIGADYSGTQFTNGTISQLIYYPRRLTNAQLVTLTR
jgi:hypothetical protein